MFEYDPDKSVANLVKHGIDFEQAQTLWDDDRRLIAPTYSGGDDERWLIVGVIGNKYWTATITVRDERMRIISVRRAWPKEVRYYDGQDD